MRKESFYTQQVGTCYSHYTLISAHLRVFSPTCVCYTRGWLPGVCEPFVSFCFPEVIFNRGPRGRTNNISEASPGRTNKVSEVQKRDQNLCWLSKVDESRLAQTTSQYYCVLQSLQKVLLSTTLYYEACASTSQYYFVLQTLRKVCPSTTILLHTASSFAETLLHTASFLTREAFTHRSFYTQHAFTHSKRLNTEHFYTECFYTWQAFTHTHRSFYTEKLLHTVSFYTQQAFAEKSFYREKLSCT